MNRVRELDPHRPLSMGLGYLFQQSITNGFASGVKRTAELG
jgi:hypothetical protein